MADTADDSLPDPDIFLPDIEKVYLNLRPMFTKAFMQFDRENRAYWDRKEFTEFKNKVMSSTTIREAYAAYEGKIGEAKKVFRQDMRKAQLTFENMDSNEDLKIDYQEFENFWRHKEVIKKLQEEGIGLTFLMFQTLGIPTFQDQYMNLKETFKALFLSYDHVGRGWIANADFREIVYRLTQPRKKPIDEIFTLIPETDRKVTWKIFWEFVSQTALLATTKDALEATEEALAAIPRGRFIHYRSPRSRGR